MSAKSLAKEAAIWSMRGRMKRMAYREPRTLSTQRFKMASDF